MLHATKASKSFLTVSYKLFDQVYIFIETEINDKNYPYSYISNTVQKEKVWLLLHSAFNELQAHGHSGNIKSSNILLYLISSNGC